MTTLMNLLVRVISIRAIICQERLNSNMFLAHFHKHQIAKFRDKNGRCSATIIAVIAE